MKTPQHVDLHSLSEDERIAVIGHTVTVHLKTVGVIVDDEPGKVERYIAKLQKRFPTVVVLAQVKGPTKRAVTIKVGPQRQ